jgi:hypothetical protein
MTTKTATSTKTGSVEHPHWKLWVQAVRRSGNDKLNALLDHLKKSAENQKSRDPDYNFTYVDILKDLFSEIGARLNHMTDREGDFRVSCHHVGDEYGIPRKDLRNLFYSTGSLSKELLPFELDKSKRSSDEVFPLLATKLKKSAGGDDKKLLDGLADLISEYFPKKNANVQKLVQIFSVSDSVSEAAEAIASLHKSLDDKPVENTKKKKEPMVVSRIPWEKKAQVVNARRYASYRGIKLDSRIHGLEAHVSMPDMINLGIAKYSKQDSDRLASRVRTLGIPLRGIQGFNTPDGKKFVDMELRATRKVASKIAKDLVGHQGFLIANVSDFTGTPVKIFRGHLKLAQPKA